MPNVDMLFNQLQKRNINSVYITGIIQKFTNSMHGQFFMENLQGTFTETVSLLKILITTPMTTEESERCLSTLKKIKIFPRNTMTQDRLNALAMVSMQKNYQKHS
eukprot:superscaffoldBa00000332_g3862